MAPTATESSTRSSRRKLNSEMTMGPSTTQRSTQSIGSKATSETTIGNITTLSSTKSTRRESNCDLHHDGSGIDADDMIKPVATIRKVSGAIGRKVAENFETFEDVQPRGLEHYSHDPKVQNAVSQIRAIFEDDYVTYYENNLLSNVQARIVEPLQRKVEELMKGDFAVEDKLALVQQVKDQTHEFFGKVASVVDQATHLGGVAIGAAKDSSKGYIAKAPSSARKVISARPQFQFGGRIMRILRQRVQNKMVLEKEMKILGEQQKSMTEQLERCETALTMILQLQRQNAHIWSAQDSLVLTEASKPVPLANAVYEESHAVDEFWSSAYIDDDYGDADNLELMAAASSQSLEAASSDNDMFDEDSRHSTKISL